MLISIRKKHYFLLLLLLLGRVNIYKIPATILNYPIRLATRQHRRAIKKVQYCFILLLKRAKHNILLPAMINRRYYYHSRYNVPLSQYNRSKINWPILFCWGSSGGLVGVLYLTRKTSNVAQAANQDQVVAVNKKEALPKKVHLKQLKTREVGKLKKEIEKTFFQLSLLKEVHKLSFPIEMDAKKRALALGAMIQMQWCIEEIDSYCFDKKVKLSMLSLGTLGIVLLCLQYTGELPEIRNNIGTLSLKRKKLVTELDQLKNQLNMQKQKDGKKGALLAFFNDSNKFSKLAQNYMEPRLQVRLKALYYKVLPTAYKSEKCDLDSVFAAYKIFSTTRHSKL